MPDKEILAEYASRLIDAQQNPDSPIYPLLDATAKLLGDGTPDSAVLSITRGALETRRARLKAELTAITNFLSPEQKASAEKAPDLEVRIEQPVEVPEPRGDGKEVQPPQAQVLAPPAQNLVTRLEAPGAIQKSDEEVQVGNFTYIPKARAYSLLLSETKNKPFTDDAMHVLRVINEENRELVYKDHILKAIELFKRCSKIYPGDVAGLLNLEDVADAREVLSSYPGQEIRDLVRIINPFHRYRRQIYLLQRGISLAGLKEPLSLILASLDQGAYSYGGVSKVLQSRRMPPEVKYFDQVVELSFERNPDGTYTEQSVSDFKAKTDGFRFMKIRNLFGEVAIPALKALASYQGDSAIPIDLTQSPLYTPGEPGVVYLFRCNKQGLVELDTLETELGIRIIHNSKS